jgi:uncharacterized protein (TIGR02611 family)
VTRHPLEGTGSAGSADSAETPDPATAHTEDHHLLRDSTDPDDWAWRREIRRRPAALAAYRAVVFSVGIVLVIGGLVMVPLPGPGWLVVILGLAILASEFEPAQRALDFVKAKVRAWERWVRSEPWWVQGFFALLTAAFVTGVVWVSLRISGVPTWLPDAVEQLVIDGGHLPPRKP